MALLSLLVVSSHTKFRRIQQEGERYFVWDDAISGFGIRVSDLPANSVAGPSEHAPPSPYLEWPKQNIPKETIGFRSNDVEVLWNAVRSGWGAGFLPRDLAVGTDFVELIPAVDNWNEQIWLVTHVDLH